LAQEHLLQAWCSAFDTPLSVLRLQNVYGPGQSVGNAYTGVLTFFARQVTNRETIAVYEDGNITRDFVFIGDVVAAIEAAIDQPPAKSRTLDVGSGERTNLLDVARIMSEVANAPEPQVTGQYRLGDVRAAWADIEPTSRDLGWVPQTSLRDGLDQLLSRVGSGT
jgi:dTDP-L-rhamnose 4-epimerase